MSKATWICDMLKLSNSGKIGEKNRLWLEENAEKLNLQIDIGDCMADYSDIVVESSNRSSILIQNGIAIEFKNFDFLKEALLITKQSSAGDKYFASIYSYR